MIQTLKKINYLQVGITIMVLAFALLPFAAFAQGSIPQPPCSSFNGLNCSDTNMGVVDLIVKIVNFLLGVAFIIAVLFLVIGGFKFIISNGNAEQAKAGRATITNALIGIAVIIVSYILVSVIARAAGNFGSGGSGGGF
jgi:hypothetical protein